MTIRRIYADGKLVDVTGVGYEPKGDFWLTVQRSHLELIPPCAPCSERVFYATTRPSTPQTVSKESRVTLPKVLCW
jgi:hypothetical protein